MKRKTTRLTFTEEELANPNIRRAAKKATHALTGPTRPRRNFPPAPRPSGALRWTPTRPKSGAPSSASARRNLGGDIAKPKRRKSGAEALLGGEAHRQIDKQNRDETPVYRPPTRGNAWPRVRLKS